MPLAIRVARVAGSSAAAVSHRSFEFNPASVDASHSCPESLSSDAASVYFSGSSSPAQARLQCFVCQALARSAPVDPNSKTTWLDQVSNAEQNHRPCHLPLVRLRVRVTFECAVSLARARLFSSRTLPPMSSLRQESDGGASITLKSSSLVRRTTAAGRRSGRAMKGIASQIGHCSSESQPVIQVTGNSRALRASL